jgi:hypothetical protein
MILEGTGIGGKNIKRFWTGLLSCFKEFLIAFSLFWV